jgi:hypothetical protein
MLVHSVVGGAAALAVLEAFEVVHLDGIPAQVLPLGLLVNTLVVSVELLMPHLLLMPRLLSK